MNPEVFEEVENLLQSINAEHAELNERIKNMMRDYHFHHILEEECAKIVEVEQPSQYFEKVYLYIQEVKGTLIN
jgi:hypothetical protein